MAFREALYSVAPAAYAAGIPITGLGAIMHAARGGIDILAVAIGGALVAALESAADKANVMETRLKEIMGQSAGATAFNALSEGAKAANLSLSDIIPTFETLMQKQQQLGANKGFVGDLSFLGLGDNAKTALLEFGKALQLDGDTGDVASKALGTYFDAMQKVNTATGKATGLTTDLFQSIEKESPRAAQLLAQGLNFGEGPSAVTQLMRSLEQGATITIPQLLQAFQRMGPTIDNELSTRIPGLAQSFNQVKNSALELFTAIGRAEGITSFATALGSVSEAMKGLSSSQDGIQNVIEGFKTFTTLIVGMRAGPAGALAAFTILFKSEMDKMVEDMGFSQGAVENFNEALKVITVAAAFSVNPFLGIITALIEFRSEIKDTIDWINKLIEAKTQMAQAATGAIPGAMLGAGAGFMVGGPVGAIAGGLLGGAAGAFAATRGGPTQSTGDQQTDQFANETAMQNGDAVSLVLEKVKQASDAASASVGMLNSSFAATPAVAEQAGSAASKAAQTASSAVSQSNLAIVQSTQAAIAQMNAASVGAGVSGAGNAVSGPSFSTDQFATETSAQTVGFATGGAFTVGGSGGTDTTRVSFMATPGETVTVTPQGLDAPAGLGGAVSATSLPMSTTPAQNTATGTAAAATIVVAAPSTAAQSPVNDSLLHSTLSNAVANGSGGLVTTMSGAKVDIVTAVNTMNANVTAALANIAATTAKAATTATAAATAATAASSGSGGSGGFRLKGDNSPILAAQMKEAAAYEKDSAAQQAIAEKQTAAADALHNAAIDIQNGVATQQEQQLYNASGMGNTTGWGMPRNAQPSASGGTLPPNSRQVGGLPPHSVSAPSFNVGYDIPGGYSDTGGYGVGSPQTGNFVTPPSGQIDMTGNSLDSMMAQGSAYTGPSAYDNLSSYADYATSPSTYASSTPLDSVDPNSFYGNYADGGSFAVGGFGGTDSQPVRFNATPGEPVAIGNDGISQILHSVLAKVDLGGMFSGLINPVQTAPQAPAPSAVQFAPHTSTEINHTVVNQAAQSATQPIIMPAPLQSPSDNVQPETSVPPWFTPLSASTPESQPNISPPSAVSQPIVPDFSGLLSGLSSLATSTPELPSARQPDFLAAQRPIVPDFSGLISGISSLITSKPDTPIAASVAQPSAAPLPPIHAPEPADKKNTDNQDAQNARQIGRNNKSLTFKVAQDRNGQPAFVASMSQMQRAIQAAR
jgi:hypothetical protein